MRRFVSVVATGVLLSVVSWAPSSRAQSVSFGVNVGGRKPVQNNAESAQDKAKKNAPTPTTSGPTQEQYRAWNQREAGSKAVRALSVLVAKIQQAVDNTSYPCLNLGLSQEAEAKEVFADLATLEAVRKECRDGVYGSLNTCASLRDDDKFQQAFTYFFSCELDDALKSRQRRAKEIGQSMTAELGSLSQMQSPEKLSASDKWVPLIRDRATNLHLNLSSLDAKIAETENLEKALFEKLTAPALKAVEHNVAAEKAANEAVAKAVANFGCKDCKVVRSVIVGKDYFYERNSLGVVTWRGKDTLTLVKTGDEKVCGVVDARAGQVAVGTKFVPTFNAYVPVRYLHMVRCP